MRIGTRGLVALGLAASMVAGTALAQDAQYAHAAIASGNLAQAERDLTRDTRAGSREPEVLLNLAAVYAMTNRPDEARALYAKVLANRDASLVLPSSRVADAHDVARTGLRLLDRSGAVQMSAR